jgi:hypothetical protein
MQPEAFGELTKRSRQPKYQHHALFSFQGESGIRLVEIGLAEPPVKYRHCDHHDERD